MCVAVTMMLQFLQQMPLVFDCLSFNPNLIVKSQHIWFLEVNFISGKFNIMALKQQGVTEQTTEQQHITKP